VLRAALRVLRVALVVAVSIGGLWLVGTVLWWCVESASDELQAPVSTEGYAAFLVVLGLVPVGAGLCAWLVARHAVRWSRWTALTVAAAVGGGVSVPVLIVRAWLPPPG
jgi:hypothetical protein